MRYIREGFVILLFSVAGEAAHALIPLPIPASIYGLVLLTLALKTGLLPIRLIEKTGDLLIGLMPLMFVPAGVGLISSWGLLERSLLPVCAIIVISTVLVFAVSGRVAQRMLRHGKEDEHA